MVRCGLTLLGAVAMNARSNQDLSVTAVKQREGWKPRKDLFRPFPSGLISGKCRRTSGPSTRRFVCGSGKTRKIYGRFGTFFHCTFDCAIAELPIASLPNLRWLDSPPPFRKFLSQNVDKNVLAVKIHERFVKTGEWPILREQQSPFVLASFALLCRRASALWPAFETRRQTGQGALHCVVRTNPFLLLVDMMYVC